MIALTMNGTTEEKLLKRLFVVHVAFYLPESNEFPIPSDQGEISYFSPRRFEAGVSHSL